MKRIGFILGIVVMASVVTAEDTSKLGISFKDGVVEVFPDNPKEGVVIKAPIGNKERLWVSAVRRNGKTRQIRITSYHGRPGNVVTVKFRYPFGDASATWSQKISRTGDIVTAKVKWNVILIGDILDPDEGAEAAQKARKKLGLTEPDSKLPVIYSSGDSISNGYWPYLEAALFDDMNVYNQSELAKDIKEVVLQNNGRANLAYGVLTKAYKHEAFKPDYLLINFGLHMLRAYEKNIPGYRKWLEKFIALAKEKNAKLIFVTTTPYDEQKPVGKGQPPFRANWNRVSDKFNEQMKDAGAKNKVPVIDLNAFTCEGVRTLGHEKVYTPDGVHFTEDFKNQQATFIAKRVREIIATEKAAKGKDNPLTPGPPTHGHAESNVLSVMRRAGQAEDGVWASGHRLPMTTGKPVRARASFTAGWDICEMKPLASLVTAARTLPGFSLTCRTYQSGRVMAKRRTPRVTDRQYQRCRSVHAEMCMSLAMDLHHMIRKRECG